MTVCPEPLALNSPYYRTAGRAVVAAAAATGTVTAVEQEVEAEEDEEEEATLIRRTYEEEGSGENE